MGLFIYFTNWTQLANLLALIIGIILQFSPTYTLKNAPNLHALHHIFYTLAMFMMPAVVIIYWGFNHGANLKEMEEKYEDDEALLW